MINKKKNIINFIKDELYDCEIPAVVVGDIIRFNNKVIDKELACELFDEVYVAELVKARDLFIDSLCESNSNTFTKKELDEVLKNSIYSKLCELNKYIKLDTGKVDTSFPFDLFDDEDILKKAIRINPRLLTEYSKIPRYEYILGNVLSDKIFNDVDLFKSAVIVKPNIIYFAGDRVRRNVDVAMNYIESNPKSLEVFSHKVIDNRDVLVAYMISRLKNKEKEIDYDDVVEAVLSVLKQSRYAITDKNILYFKRRIEEELNELNQEIDISDIEYLENYFDEYLENYLGLDEDVLNKYKNKTCMDIKKLKKTSR